MEYLFLQVCIYHLPCTSSKSTTALSIKWLLIFCIKKQIRPNVLRNMLMMFSILYNTFQQDFISVKLIYDPSSVIYMQKLRTLLNEYMLNLIISRFNIDLFIYSFNSKASMRQISHKCCFTTHYVTKTLLVVFFLLVLKELEEETKCLMNYQFNTGWISILISEDEKNDMVL